MTVSLESTRKDLAKSSRERADSQRPLIWALREAGVNVTSVWDFVNGPTPPLAIPVLVKHLQRDYLYAVREGIARSLIVKDAPVEVKDLFVKEFLSLPGDDEDKDRYYYKVALAIGIGYHSSKSDVAQLISLAVDEKHGAARHAIITALARKGKSQAGDVLLTLLGQKDVLAPVIDALAYLRDPRARDFVDALLKNKPVDEYDKSVHRVAKKYLKRIG